MECPNTKKCPLFPQFRTGALRVLKAIYCEADFTRCARYQSMKSGVVPALTLLPNGRHLHRAGRFESTRD